MVKENTKDRATLEKEADDLIERKIRCFVNETKDGGNDLKPQDNEDL